MLKNLSKLTFYALALGGLILAPLGLIKPQDVQAASSSNTGSIHIRAWVDTDGDNAYSLNEGIIFKGTRFEIRDMATNKLIDPELCRFDDFMLGGVGRNDCTNIPFGKYMVTFFGEDPWQYAGPIKSKWNPSGVNPIAPIEIKQGFKNNILDFGYTKLANPQTGDIIIHAYEDLDSNGQWSGYGSSEGTPFFNKSYTIKSVKTGQQIDYTRHCNWGTNRLGGAGEDICRGLPAGDYIVTFDIDDDNWVQINGWHNRTASNPMRITVAGGQIVVPEFGYGKKSVIEVRAYVDKDNNRAYTVGTGEGKKMAGKEVHIYDIRGDEIKYSRCSSSNKTGKDGRLWCAVGQGGYSVLFTDFDPVLFVGPLKTQYNPQGEDPVSVSVNPNRISAVGFGFIYNYIYQ